jgi:hypothetical protein
LRHDVCATLPGGTARPRWATFEKISARKTFFSGNNRARFVSYVVNEAGHRGRLGSPTRACRSRKDGSPVKKLLAMLGIGGLFLVCLTGCPSPTSNPTSGTTTTTTTTTKPKETTTTEKKETKIEGAYVKHEKEKLTLKVGGEDKDFDVKGIKPMVDGKEGKWDDVKEKATVTVHEKEGKVTKVEAKNEAAAPPPPSESKPVEGKFDKYDKEKTKLTITVDGKPKEYDVKDIKPTVDGKEGKWDDIKEKATVTVTEKDGKATKVEAKNP